MEDRWHIRKGINPETPNRVNENMTNWPIIIFFLLMNFTLNFKNELGMF